MEALRATRAFGQATLDFGMITLLDYAPDSFKRRVLSGEYEGEALERRLKMRLGGRECPYEIGFMLSSIVSIIIPTNLEWSPPPTRRFAHRCPPHHPPGSVRESYRMFMALWGMASINLRPRLPVGHALRPGRVALATAGAGDAAAEQLDLASLCRAGRPLVLNFGSCS